MYENRSLYEVTHDDATHDDATRDEEIRNELTHSKNANKMFHEFDF